MTDEMIFGLEVLSGSIACIIICSVVLRSIVKKAQFESQWKKRGK